jgi:hypothetical protein
MRVELYVPESVTEPRMWVKHQPVLATALRRGSVEMGLRRSEMKRQTYDAGEMSLIPRHLEKWMELWHQAAVEQDPKKLLELTAEIIRLLDDKEDRLIHRAAKPEDGPTPQP